MTIEWNIRAVGSLTLVIACSHAFFPRWFQWREDLSRLNLLNRQIFQVHTLFVVLVLVLLGLLLLIYAKTMLGAGELGRVLFYGIGAFWAIRLVVQVWYYDRSLWRGNTQRTILHVLATTLCLYSAATCFWAGLSATEATWNR